MSAFNKMFWGLLFLLDFRVNGFDILPDIIGYVFFFSGLTELMLKNRYFHQARTLAIPLIVISIFDIFQPQNSGQRIDFNAGSFLLMLIGITAIILNLLMIYNVTKGIGLVAREKGDYALETLADKRWNYYLYTNIGIALAIFIAVIIPSTAILLFVVLFIISIIVYILMMQLMQQADRTL